MITGDIRETAETVAREIGIVENDDAVVRSRSITGEDFEKMTEQQQLDLTSKCIGSLNGLIFSRTEPLHKKQLVQILSKQVKKNFI
jgi:Ca2+-transporting ATPase